MNKAKTPELATKQPFRWYNVLYLQVLVAVILGVLLGYFYPKLGESLKPLGDAFINLVKMVIAPVIFLTVTTGIGSMSKVSKVGSVFAKALGYFLVVSSLALVIGLVVANVVQPGAGLHIAPGALNAKAVADYETKAHATTVVGFLSNIIPKTPVSALADGDILQVLFVAVITGLSIALAGSRGEPLLKVFESANAVVFKMVALLMRFAPIGAFAAIAFTIGKFGIASIVSLAALVGTFYLTSILFVVIVLGVIGKFAGFSIFKLVRYLRAELLIVLGTSSSEAALPSLMSKMEAAGCHKEVVGLVIPAGYSFNLDGTNIYMTLAAMFIAQATGVHLSLEQQLLLVSVAMLSSKGAAGVTGSGFIVLAATLSVVPSVPVAGMALILGIDRFMSECRALTNLIGNAVATIVVAKWEKSLDTGQLQAALTS